jgi:hypothetical protein
LKKTEYLVNIHNINGEEIDIKGSLQPHGWNESSLISNLLVSTSVKKFKTGDIL